MSDNKDFNLDALLDGTLDDLADIPEFKPLPAGSHRLLISLNQKVIANKPAVEMSIKLLETIELSAGQEEAAPGLETNVAYFLDNEIGQGQLKGVLAAIKPAFPDVVSNRDLIAAAKNVEVLAVSAVRMNKEKTKSFTNIVEVALV